MKMNTCIDNLTPWTDTDGNPIHTHGGGIITIGDTFYWYGENKEKTTGQDAIWHWGVRCYSSKDLMNWHSEGIIIPPDTEDPASPLHPHQFMDRPHILYCEATGKYVCWMKIMDNPSYFAVMQADSVLGPYSFVNPHLNPFGLQVGDFDLAVDPLTKKGYLISEKPHTCMYTAALNESYTDVEGVFTEHFYHEAPPDSREAPAWFVRNGRIYLLTSGTTSYFPNPTEVSGAETWLGEYTVFGNAHREDRSKTSFNSQISSVFHHPFKKDLYIAIGDCWMSDLPQREGDLFTEGKTSERIHQLFKDLFNPEIEVDYSNPDIVASMRVNTSRAGYLWLPVRFENGVPYLSWTDSFAPDDWG